MKNGRTENAGDTLSVVIRKCVDANFAPGFSPQRRNLIDRKLHAGWIACASTATIHIENLYRMILTSPRYREFCRQFICKVNDSRLAGRPATIGWIGCQLYGLGRPESRSLMMA